MDLDFSMVTMADVLEYFKAIFTSILEMFGINLEDGFSIGGLEITFGNKAE